mgnify:CR=1 FL=1
MPAVYPKRERVITERSRKTIKGKSKTRQSQEAECNVNNIVKKYQQKGIIPHLSAKQPRYGVAPQIDLKEAMDLVQASHEAFNGLSADMRKKFGNDVNKFAAALDDPEVMAEIAKAGHVIPDEQTPPPAENPRPTPTGSGVGSEAPQGDTGGEDGA